VANWQAHWNQLLVAVLAFQYATETWSRGVVATSTGGVLTSELVSQEIYDFKTREKDKQLWQK
jgi:hypothetical protein